MENTTPSPATQDWYSKEDPYGSGEHWIYDGDDNFVASVAFVADDDGIDKEKSRVHAGLIVRDRNVHDELVEVCTNQLENWRMLLRGEGDGNREGVELAISNLEHVLGKANEQAS